MDSTSQCRCGKVLKEHVKWKILYKIQCAICKLSGYHLVYGEYTVGVGIFSD